MIQTHIMDDRFFNEVVVRDEMNKLRALLRAIPKWEEVAVAEVDALTASDLSEMSEEQRHWHSEYVNDRYYGIEETKEGLYRSFAVSVASTVENLMGLFCSEHAVALRERPNWNHNRQGLARLIGATGWTSTASPASTRQTGRESWRTASSTATARSARSTSTTSAPACSGRRSAIKTRTGQRSSTAPKRLSWSWRSASPLGGNSASEGTDHAPVRNP
jgi:hypothetical protein